MAQWDIERNNTSFPSVMLETLKSIHKTSTDPLQYHQRLVVEYLMHYDNIRGLVAYHKMGSGKSILAAAACESMLEVDRTKAALNGNSANTRKVIFFASKSLHNNFRDNIIKYIKMRDADTSPTDIEAHITANYTFISLNASNMIKQVYKVRKDTNLDKINEVYEELLSPDDADTIEPLMDKLDSIGDLNNTFVVMDEAHNFFNSVVNGSANAANLYTLLRDARNTKILFLTGSFIINDPFEAAIAYNLLATPSKSTSGHDVLFGENHEDFTKYFIAHNDALELDTSITQYAPPRIKNGEKFGYRIVGLTSYYDAADLSDRFPELLPLIVRRIPMSPGRQFAMYTEARDKELEMAKRRIFKPKKPAPLQKSSGASSSYRVRSRQLSNICYPVEAVESFKDARGRPTYKLLPEKLTDAHFSAESLTKISPKILAILQCAATHSPPGILNAFKGAKKGGHESPGGRGSLPPIGPGLIYSQFHDSGIAAIAKALKAHGFVDAADGPSKGAPAFCSISGDVDIDTRTALLERFNAPDNIRGEKITLMLFTAAGAEGISTKNVRYVIITEPFWHWTRIEQVLHRAVRLDSHMSLPPADRTVQPYIFLADYPAATDAKRITEATTDITIYTKARQKQRLVDEFLEWCQRAAVDCPIYAKSTGHKCITCQPTDRMLFIENLDKDMKSTKQKSPGMASDEVKKEKVKVQKVTINGRDYYYDAIGKRLFINMAGIYEEVDEHNPDYEAIIREVESA